MNKAKRKIIVCFSLTLIAGFSLSASASIAPPNNVINEKTKECAGFIAGDECVRCDLPQGWRNIGQNPCPQGYKETEVVPVCVPQKTFFCCTQLHSGLNGDCEDVVVNEDDEKCAFAQDIDKCSVLPKGWKRAEEKAGWGRVCPLEYKWMDNNIECGEISENGGEPPKDGNEPPDQQPIFNYIFNNNQGKINFIFPIIVITATLFLIFIIYNLIRLKKKNKRLP